MSACAEFGDLHSFKLRQMLVALKICNLLRHSLWGSALTYFVAFHQVLKILHGFWPLINVFYCSWHEFLLFPLQLVHSFSRGHFVQCWGRVPWPASFWRFWIDLNRTIQDLKRPDCLHAAFSIFQHLSALKANPLIMWKSHESPASLVRLMWICMIRR